MSRAIVLAGGGAVGAWQAPILKKLDIKPDELVVGCSAGAINAHAFSVGGADALIEHWRNVEGTAETMKLNLLPIVRGLTGFFSTKPLMDRLLKNAKAATFAECVVCFSDLFDGSTKYASSKDYAPKDFVKWVIASGSLPGIMEAVDGRYVDGGCAEIAPLNYAIKRGFTDITVVICRPFQENASKPFHPKFPVPLSYLAGGIDMLMHNVLLGDLKKCISRNKEGQYQKVKVTLYAPKTYLYDTLDFSKESIAKGLAAGIAAEPQVLA
jgi:predicted acylesterase/phospholipase RssA